MSADNIHPLLQEFFKLLDKSGKSEALVARLSGWDRNCFFNWRNGHNGPTVGALTDSLEAIGYELRIVKRGG